MEKAVLTRALQGPRLIFSIIGWGLLAGAFFLALRADEMRRDWIRVEGTIIDYTEGETQAPVVEYETPGGERRTVTGGVSTSPRIGDIGDRVPVYVNPENEAEARLGTAVELWFLPGLLGGIGGVFFLIGTLAGGAAGAGRAPGQISERRLKDLRETGERVMARVTEILSIGASSVSRAPAHWRLRAMWHDPATGAPVYFVSQPINIDPAPHVAVGDEIGVFIDRRNPKVYAFDFSMLPFGA